MKRGAIDFSLLIGILLVHILLFITFANKVAVFWYLYTASMLFLISYSIVMEKIDDEASTKRYLTYGIVSGIGLYLLFWTGNWLLSVLPGSFEAKVAKAYKLFSPSIIWHYLVLIFILVPGEEIFWRGFIQKRLMRYTHTWIAIFATSLLSASVFIYANNAAIMLAAFIGSVVWGLLYAWKKSIPLLIISHLVFDFLLFIILPLY